MADEDINSLMTNYNFEKLKTKNIRITKYEKTRVLSERASQIDGGAKPLISDISRFQNSYQISEEEFNQKRIPFIVKRPYNNGYEYVKLADLY